MNDKMLVINLRKGDLDAFRRIYTKYNKKVYFFSLSYLKSADKAEDIVQDVFTKIWEDRTRLSEYYSFNNFLFTVTKNLILNHIRRTKQEMGYRNSCIELSGFSEQQENNTLDSVICNDLKSYLNREIEKLPPCRRTVYKLSRIQLLSNEEIASLQNLSVRTVENQIYRALSKLKKTILEENIVPSCY